MSILKSYEQFLSERKIGSFQQKVKISVELHSTIHSDERKFRHEGKEISDSEIVSTANKALPEISDNLIFNKINIGDVIHIKDSSSDLNIIAELKQEKDSIKLVIVTIMFKKNFKAKRGTYTIEI